MSAEKKKAFKDILTRAGKTFIQAFISALGVDTIFGVTDAKTLEKILISIFVGAVAAGISAVWNSFTEWLSVRIDELDTDELSEDIAKALDDGKEDGEANG